MLIKYNSIVSLTNLKHHIIRLFVQSLLLLQKLDKSYLLIQKQAYSSPF